MVDVKSLQNARAQRPVQFLSVMMVHHVAQNFVDHVFVGVQGRF